MKTLAIVTIIWGLISFFRTRRKCKEEGVEWDPFSGTIIDYIGIIAGITSLFISAICLFATYLP